MSWEMVKKKYNRREDIVSILLVARKKEKLTEVQQQEEIHCIHPKVSRYSLSCDMSRSMGIIDAIRQIKEIPLPYNVLIKNAGYGVIEKLENIEDNDIENMLYVNLIAPLKGSKFFIPIARKNKGGRIIFISSISTHNSNPNIIPYCFQNDLKSLTECLSLCLAELENGITANTILLDLS